MQTWNIIGMLNVSVFCVIRALYTKHRSIQHTTRINDLQMRIDENVGLYMNVWFAVLSVVPL